MKKISLILLCCALLLLSACGKTVEQPADTLSQTAGASATEPETDAVSDTTAAPDADPTTEIPTTKEVFTDATVSVREADDSFDASTADVFTAESGDVQMQIVFTTDAVVRDFKVLALSDGDFGDDEKMHFTTKVLYEQPHLTPDRPLAVTTVFYGLIPNNGISYVDKDGVTRTFAVDMSGEDGSLYLWEFD